MNNGSAAVDPVDLVELRIERRRAQLLRDWEETRAYVAQKSRWTPLATVAAAAVLGFGLSRSRRASMGSGRRGDATRGGLLAVIAAVLSDGLRFAVSPTARALWTQFKQARADHRWQAAGAAGVKRRGGCASSQ